MIAQTLIDFLLNIFKVAFSGLEFIGLPFDAINALGSIVCYGTWIVGADILGLVVATIVTWWTVKFTVGLIIYIWELLPIT